MSHLRILLMVLIAMRLLMPPGICACKWTSPAARFLLSLAQSNRQIPSEPESDDDDHEPGCPASPLAAGMGVAPPCEPLPPLALALDSPSPLDSMPAILTNRTAGDDCYPCDAPSRPLYLTVRALLL